MTTESAAEAGQGAARDERQRRIAESLRVGNPANNARDLVAQTEPRLDCPIELNVNDIRSYERNPRRAGNPRFDEIKESIRVSGIRNPITVTRRPGDRHFIVEAGGNTRLIAMQQLWAETGDESFRKMSVVFRPWRSESHVLIAHLIENEQRADMTFWDKACGVAALKSQLEVEQERSLSLRQLEAALGEAGIAMGHATLSYYRFATDRLQVLGEAIPDLSGMDVTRLQPRLNQLRRYAQAQAAIDEETCYREILEPVFRQCAAQYREAGTFSAEGLGKACEEALARHLGEPVDQCRAALALQPSPVADTASPLPAAVGREVSQPQTLPDVPTADVAEAEMPPTVQSLDSWVPPVVAEKTTVEALAPVAPDTSVVPSAGSGINKEIVEQIQLFARVVGVSDCLRISTTAPLGLAVGTVPCAVEHQSPPQQFWGWWLLMLICGPVDPGETADLHDSSASDPENPQQVSGAGGEAVLTIDLPFLVWLFDPDDATCAAFRRLVTLLAGAALPLGAGCARARLHNSQEVA